MPDVEGRDAAGSPRHPRRSLTIRPPRFNLIGAPSASLRQTRGEIGVMGQRYAEGRGEPPVKARRKSAGQSAGSIRQTKRPPENGGIDGDLVAPRRGSRARDRGRLGRIEGERRPQHRVGGKTKVRIAEGLAASASEGADPARPVPILVSTKAASTRSAQMLMTARVSSSSASIEAIAPRRSGRVNDDRRGIDDLDKAGPAKDRPGRWGRGGRWARGRRPRREDGISRRPWRRGRW